MTSFLPLIPLAYFGLQLSVIDFKTHRLPNRLVGQFAGFEIIALSVASWYDSDYVRFALAFGAAVATLAAYFLLYLFSRGSLGLGDVKFAFPLGLCVGWCAPELWLAAIFGTFVIAGLIATLGMLTKRMNRNSRLALGPYMFFSTLLTCLVGM